MDEPPAVSVGLREGEQLVGLLLGRGDGVQLAGPPEQREEMLNEWLSDVAPRISCLSLSSSRFSRS